MNRAPGASNRWIIAAVAGLAGLALISGTVLLLRNSTGATGTNQEHVPVHAEKPPQAFGLPTYNGAFGFHSLEAKDGRGSSSYSVKSGNSAAIAAFYRAQLEKDGWKLLWQTAAREQPGSPTGAHLPPARGQRARWTKDGLQLTLLALDFPQSGSAGQVLLTWSPAPSKPEAASGDPHR